MQIWALLENGKVVQVPAGVALHSSCRQKHWNTWVFLDFQSGGFTRKKIHNKHTYFREQQDYTFLELILKRKKMIKVFPAIWRKIELKGMITHAERIKIEKMCFLAKRCTNPDRYKPPWERNSQKKNLGKVSCKMRNKLNFNAIFLHLSVLQAEGHISF